MKEKAKDMSEPFIDDELLKQFMEECVRSFFPHANYMRAGAMGRPESTKLKSIELDFSSSFKHLLDTPYCYKGTYKFLHFTTLKGLYGILRDKSIRMYNLKSMDDIDEIKYSLRSLGLNFNSKYTEDAFCDGFYCLSMVQPSIELNGKSLELWRAYGQDGRGVAIELSFNKRNFFRWMNYSLSKVHYGQKPFQFLNQWREKYLSFQKETGFTIQNFDKLFSHVHAYHKRDIYQGEKEVRLLFDLKKQERFNVMRVDELKHNDERISFDINGANMPTDFKILELEWDRWKTFNDKMKKYRNEVKYLHPFVKVSRVIFGYRLKRAEQIEIVDHIRNTFNSKLDFSDSVLRPYFQEEYSDNDLYGNSLKKK